MQKWMITYAFLLGMLSVNLCGHASPSYLFYAPANSEMEIKKSASFEDHIEKTENRGNYLLMGHRTRLSFSITSFFAIKENGIVLSACCTNRVKMVAAEAGKIFCDHLLHLFPSHYFW
jgi:hypothetical protein